MLLTVTFLNNMVPLIGNIIIEIPNKGMVDSQHDKILILISQWDERS